jgi:tetratricopeptide (TPR) repeat protein
MLELPGVTLCCVDTVNHALALRALRHCTVGIRFAQVRFITDRAIGQPGIETRIISPLATRDAYSEFVLKSLSRHIETPHVLLVQWDGYVVNPGAWRSEFLDADYIGAKWYWHTDGMRVGNGGFSLRSRKLLEALQDPRVVLTEAEDVTIGRSARPLLEREYGIRFAPEALADVFAFEAAYPIGRPFGFHGLYNFCRVVPPNEIVELVRHFTPAIARSPQLAQLARNCLAMAQWNAAAAIFQCILEQSPDDAAALSGLATATSNASVIPAVGRNDPCPCGSGKRYKHCHGVPGTHETAVASANSVHASTQQRMTSAVSSQQRGDTAAAEAIYRDVLAREPGHPVAQHYLGVIEYQRGALAMALPLLEASTAALREEPEFHNNLGLAYAASDREPDAIAEYRAAIALKADHAVAWNNLGLALQSINDVAGATDAFRRAIAIDARFAHAHWNLALVLLLAGRFDEGFAEYDWRLALPELGKGKHAYPGAAWDGGDVRAKTLLLYAEQGLGDAVQFARFAAVLAERGARVIIACQPALHALLMTVPGVADVISNDAELPRYDAHIALLSLPRLLCTDVGSIPAHVPYIDAASARRDAMRAMLARQTGRLKVGVAWAGNKMHTNDRNRSLPLTTLAPLFDLPGIAWQSLQYGDSAAQLAALPGAQRIAPLPATTTLADTAALIAELDLIVSVDTAIAHLAGALARPCWVMLPFAPDWRWMLGHDDSPWYPTLRLFRQGAAHDWSGVIARIASELTSLAQS